MKIYRVKVNGKAYEVEVEAVDEVGGSIAVQPKENREPQREVKGDKIIAAPISGKVTEVKVAKGDVVSKGQTVMIIEAMKLENEIQSAFEGTVASVLVAKGDDVKNKEALIVLQ